MTETGARLLVLWVADWPVIAYVREHRGVSGAPLALIGSGVVQSCSAAARAEGVRRGMRQREAQSRCPGLRVSRHDPGLDARAFEEVLTALEAVLPGVHPVRPGTVAVRVRGPARFYGGERAAALRVVATAAELGLPGARVGVADGLFAAEQAARSADAAGIVIVPPGEQAAFLAPLPVNVLGDPELGGLLPRLGIRTLGGFAALAPGDVAARFGPDGARLHALAGGRDPRGAAPRIPPREFDVRVGFETALDRADQVAFGVRGIADAFIAGLLAQRLVCTAVRIEFTTENGDGSDRVWLHPRSFTAAEVVDRVRWQLDGADLRSGVTEVRIRPDAVDPAGAHERGLWGTGPDEGVHSGLSRVQGMLGHRGVLTAVPAGGRSPAERQAMVPWGDRPVVARDPTPPWPGALPPPAPATVYAVPRPLSVRDAHDRPVTVDERGALSAPPAVMVSQTGARRRLTAWAGPWPLDERWWDAREARTASRFQAVDAGGEAWLLVLDAEGWWAHGHYD
ncbi:MAG: DNA polymerase Y family protein [Microbacteriaceae bacterium]|nr:DNA polymerase Y family protein [Microbacteriaceae bacterium]